MSWIIFEILPWKQGVKRSKFNVKAYPGVYFMVKWDPVNSNQKEQSKNLNFLLTKIGISPQKIWIFYVYINMNFIFISKEVSRWVDFRTLTELKTSRNFQQICILIENHDSYQKHISSEKCMVFWLLLSQFLQFNLVDGSENYSSRRFFWDTYREVLKQI